MKPYIEHKIDNDTVIRTFKEFTDEDDFRWHRDLEDRVVEALNDNDWMIQLEDQIPLNISTGESLMIPMGKWHRIIKGSKYAIYRINKIKKNNAYV